MPRDWTKLGEGGNAIVWLADGVAVKRLKQTANAEARARFKRECAMVTAMQARDDLKVVPTRGVRRREDADEIVMDVLDGNLEEVVGRFRSQPTMAAAALIPVIGTLAVLAEGTPRIHHRDLKPTNLLYLSHETNLYLGDFGCAFLSDGERITPDLRALGAWAFRPPEYSGGRLEEVDEKGDVFSMGKVFWSMINGEAHTTFPGPLWFLPEYDLSTICVGTEGAAEAMYIIARCCRIRPESRPTLREFLAMLESLVNRTPSTPSIIGAGALTNEQQREIEYAQRRAIARPFLLLLIDDLEGALTTLQESNPQSLLLDAWLTEWRRIPNRREQLLEQVVEHESDTPVMNFFKWQRMLFTRFYPVGMNGPLRFLASYGPAHEQHFIPRLTVEALDDGIVALVEGLSDAAERMPYSSTTLVGFLARAIAAS